MSYNPQKGNILVWVTVVISIVALILAWVAFNRSGDDVEMVVEEAVAEAVAELRAELDLNGDEGESNQTEPDNSNGTDAEVEVE